MKTETMNTTESNKLIAEFMGAQNNNPYGEYELYGILEFINDGLNEQHFFPLKDMRFHESWDWLMPVVEKCLTELNDEDNYYSMLHDALFTINIDEVYQSVINYILWYNEEILWYNEE